MKINWDNHQKVMDLIIQQYGNGYNTVAFNRDAVVLQGDDLRFFKDRHEAEKFCRQSGEGYDFKYAAAIIQAMFDGLRDPALLVQENSLVDLSAMITANELSTDYELPKAVPIDQENVNAIVKGHKFGGFGIAGNQEAVEMMKAGFPAFELPHKKEFGQDEATALRYYSRSDKEKQWYFFNKYDLTVTGDGIAPVKQTFYLRRPEPGMVQLANGGIQTVWVSSNITLTEGYNLLRERAVLKNYVNKEGYKYTAWTKLDLNDADEKGNHKFIKFPTYDLGQILSQYPIREIENPENRIRLLAVLERGDLCPVTFGMADGTERIMFVEAEPKFKSINLYDQDGKVVRNWKDIKEPVVQSISIAPSVRPAQVELPAVQSTATVPPVQPAQVESAAQSTAIVPPVPPAQVESAAQSTANVPPVPPAQVESAAGQQTAIVPSEQPTQAGLPVSGSKPGNKLDRLITRATGAGKKTVEKRPKRARQKAG